MRHFCDCGQVYDSELAVLACQNGRHSGYAENELADALAFATDNGIDIEAQNG